jgi:hypothetical protein
VSSDESRAVQKSHIAVPPSQNWLGERPLSVAPLLPTPWCSHSYGAQLEGISDFRAASPSEEDTILLVSPAQWIELLHPSGRSAYSGPYRSIGLYTSFRWISRWVVFESDNVS